MSEGIALMLRVGIVGANGHLGSHLSDILMRNTPHEIYPILRDESPPLDLDVVFEAKAKEQAILKYRELHGDENCQLAAK